MARPGTSPGSILTGAAFLLLLCGCADSPAPTGILREISIRVAGMVKAQGIT